MALPATLETRTLAWHHMKQFLLEQEAEHRRLLSMWVSELEPEFVYSRDAMQLIGITVKGWPDVVFYAKGWTRSAQVSQDRWMMLVFNPTRWPVPRDFHWNTGVDLAAADDRTVHTAYDPQLKISFSVETKDIGPALFKKMLQVTMPKVKE